jgi:hypothetical protein
LVFLAGDSKNLEPKTRTKIILIPIKFSGTLLLFMTNSSNIIKLSLKKLVMAKHASADVNLIFTAYTSRRIFNLISQNMLKQTVPLSTGLAFLAFKMHF